MTGRGNYKGQITQNFYVYKDDISKMTFDKIADQIYTGAQIRPGENNTAAPDGVWILQNTDL
ncbi:MAG: hypothetical protein K6E16_04375 [Lachnospiraceae bacterium]|nr:hypothetical protein [Lachnospiraceae bacterium]